METLRDTIRSLTKQHLDQGYSVLGQTLTAVGFVGNTVPDDPRITEIPCSDVSNAGVVVGHALAGKRPIYIIRYQGFSWYNAAPIVNYAAKSKEMWGVPCPILIRGIAMEGAIGPVAGSSHHRLWDMPGVRIYSPMTSFEWESAYREFMEGDDVVFLSEHRGVWGDKYSWFWNSKKPQAVVFPISITRKACASLTDVYVCPLWRLRPLHVPPAAIEALKSCRYGIVLDDAHTGFAKQVAQDLHRLTGARMEVLGLQDRTAGFHFDNLPPTKEDVTKCIQTLREG